MKIAVVHNGDHAGVLHRLGQRCPERYSPRHVQLAADALLAAGHTVEVLQADIRLFEELGRFLPANPAASGPTAMVFNMAYGIQGDARYTHLPAMLEMAGIPYTGANPLGHALALDKVIAKILMADAGVPTPAYCVLDGTTTRPAPAFGSLGNKSAERLRFPLVVKPRHESTSYGLRLVRDRGELDAAVAAVAADYRQSALVEEYVEGREICIGLLGNEPMEFLPPVELDFGDRDLKIVTWEDKYHKRADEPRKVCPAPLESDQLRRLNDLALATFQACHLRDYARADIRFDAAGNPFVLEINSMASLGGGGSYMTAAQAAGYDVPSLVVRILDVACRRYFGVPAPTNEARNADGGHPHG